MAKEWRGSVVVSTPSRCATSSATGTTASGCAGLLWACGLSAVSTRARMSFTGRPRRLSWTAASASRSKLVIEISARSFRLLAETEISSYSSPLVTWAAGCSIKWTGTCLASW